MNRIERKSEGNVVPSNSSSKRAEKYGDLE